MVSTENYKIKKAPTCPHCKQKTTKTVPPPYSIGEGFGWGVSYLWICFNDDCALFVKGWEHMQENYGKSASYRFMCLPDNGMTETIAVFSHDGLKGGIVEEDKEEEEQD
ncbi:hypothetical protein BMS3Bbin07_00856 [bacterium BMS3Bbin07]|nr:hypothetical protein BMS3Bbin07_00856 [bacterium BMS3Bbin07]